MVTEYHEFYVMIFTLQLKNFVCFVFPFFRTSLTKIIFPPCKRWIPTKKVGLEQNQIFSAALRIQTMKLAQSTLPPPTLPPPSLSLPLIFHFLPVWPEWKTKDFHHQYAVSNVTIHIRNEFQIRKRINAVGGFLNCWHHRFVQVDLWPILSTNIIGYFHQWVNGHWCFHGQDSM